jgi:hypothetical protein
MFHRSLILAGVVLLSISTGPADLIAQGVEGRIFFPTPDTVGLWEFNGFPDLIDGTPLAEGTIVPDLSGNGLDATVEGNVSDLTIAPGDPNFSADNREVNRGANANGSARLAVNDDQDLFEMAPDQDFSLELYLNREGVAEPVKWGILAGTWHSRATADDTLDPNTQGAWYGYGLIRADEAQTAGPWSFVLSPLQGIDGAPQLGCCNENHAFFDIPDGYHYVVLTVDRVNQFAITYLDGAEINRRTLNPEWSFTTPTGYEHARFCMFAGEDDPSRGTFRAAPAGVDLDAARIQRMAIPPEEIADTYNNIQSGQPSPPPPNTLNAFVIASSTNVVVGQCVKVDGSGSIPGAGQTITKWEWSIAGGAFEEGSSTREVSFDKDSAVGYPVTLRVTNSAAQTDEATVKIKVQKLNLVARINVAIAGQPVVGNDVYVPVGTVLSLDGTSSAYAVPPTAVRCPIADGQLVEPPAVTAYAWDLDNKPATIEDTRPAFDTAPFNTTGDFKILLQVTAADGVKSTRGLLNLHVADPRGNTRVFHTTPDTILHFEFNELPDVADGSPIPTGSVIEDLSGNGLNGTVEANDAGDLIMGPGVGSLDVPAGANREVKHSVVSNFSARISVENDQDSFEMLPEDDFSIELYVNREAANDPIKWGILAGTWKSRNMQDDTAGNPDQLGAWYGYGLIRSDEAVVGAPWSWVLSPLDAPDAPPHIGCCWENHAFFNIPDGRHYVALSVDRVNQTATTFVDGKQAATQLLQPNWSFTTPQDFEHAVFTLFAGEDDPSRNAYRPAPAGTELDAVRFQRHALTFQEASQNWDNIRTGKGANPEFAPKLPPAAPTGLVATAGSGQVSLDWNDNTEADLQGYDVYRGTAAGGPYSKANAAMVASSSYTDTGLTNGSQYFYVVRAVGPGGSSAPSAEASATPAGGTLFRRGDADSNGLVEITDAVLVLNYMFLGGKAPDCLDAADTDDSGVLDITDPVSSLQYQFLGGVAPPSPGPTVCGPDPTVDDPFDCVTGCR